MNGDSAPAFCSSCWVLRPYNGVVFAASGNVYAKSCIFKGVFGVIDRHINHAWNVYWRICWVWPFAYFNGYCAAFFKLTAMGRLVDNKASFNALAVAFGYRNLESAVLKLARCCALRCANDVWNSNVFLTE